MEDIGSEVDVIVLGTGLTESMVAGACARIGKKVLHLDPNDHYGNEWTAFSFNQVRSWVQRQRQRSPETAPAADRQEEAGSETDGDQIYCDWTEASPIFYNVEEISYLIDKASDESVNDLEVEAPVAAASASEGGGDAIEVEPMEVQRSGETEAQTWTVQRMEENNRKFNIDLCPRLLYATGAMVELLVQSNICRYLEFKSLTRILAYFNQSKELIEVPCSRGDIFNNKTISIVQKRMLMKFMSMCLESDKNPQYFEGFEDKPFVDLISSKGLDEKLTHFVLHSVAMASENVTTTDALVLVKKFLSSLGRFGNSPFLWTLYGCGELPQAFCRLCAVFGGTYCLNRGLDGVFWDKETKKVTRAVVEGKNIDCKFIVTSLSNAPKSIVSQNSSQVLISRAIFISNGSIQSAEKEHTTITRIPVDGEIKKAVTVIEVGHSGLVVPKGLFVVYCWCEESSEGIAKNDLIPVAKKLFNFSLEPDSRPKLVWSCYYNQAYSNQEIRTNCEGVHVVNSPTDELDYDFAINEARTVFSRIFPGSEFLPRAPDPEEIIIEPLQVDAEANDIH